MKKEGILLAANYSNDTGYAWNNIYRLFGVIADSFDKLNYEVHISFASIKPPVSAIPTSAKPVFHEYDPQNQSIINTFKLIKLARKNNVRYIYLTDQHSFHYRYALIRLFGGVKKIVIHSRVSVANPHPASYEGGFKGALKATLGKWNLLCADRIYAVSDFVKDRLILKNRLPQHRVVKILNGIDIDKFSPTSESQPRSSDMIRIFVGGRATRYKGIHTLILATAALKKRTGRGFEVRYAGDGPDLIELKDMVLSLDLHDQFTFLGELTSTQNEVAEADIIVVPSIWGDACPSTVSEALASGKALIATNVGGVPEIVGTPENALLIAPGNVEELAKAMEKLLSSKDLRVKMGCGGRRRAVQALDEKVYHANVVNQLLADFGLSK